LTWDSNGTIFIDQVSIPGSNMFLTFPLLFKKKHSSLIPGLIELKTKINQMGLSDFINQSSVHSEDFSNKNQVTAEEKNKFSATKSEIKSEKWWYLGP
jgi:hypothetical protein